MYHSLDEFQRDFEHHSVETLRVLEHLSDASLSTKVDPQGRDLGFIAWHIVQTYPEMLAQAGIKGLAGPAHGAPVPTQAAQIAKAYSVVRASLMSTLRSAWTDAMLPESIPMYGQSWPRHMVLSGLLYHEVHHRGQLTVLMRQAGLKVPGVFGPAREEWGTYGLPAQP